ncbi:MAG TPA: hypothetical protein VE954_35345 [Oligoflexus sp.]|uniref:hypothetical protein n=1 Tax=Oligoflexus sp. TaxID=1971216 RepID=UPI002D23EBA0|nr:hypothetical protein [Oligoflexus sp.]HYX38408.1 hypothetical protein [Oligoflexus sp.]
MPQQDKPLEQRFPGFASFKIAYKAYHQEQDKEKSLLYLRAAARLDDSPYYRLGAAVVALKLKQVDDAAMELEGLLGHPGLDPHHRRLVAFYFAIALDVQGRHIEALPHYQSVVNDQNAWPSLKEAADSWIQEGFERDGLSSLDFDLKYFDGIRYPKREARPHLLKLPFWMQT